jgi:hypothetical protein
MNLFKAKVTLVMMGALLVGLMVITSYGAAEAKSTLSDVASVTADRESLIEVVPSMPNASELRLSPSYYLDDVTIIDSANAPVASELRFSPSYYRDDAAKVDTAAIAPNSSALRFSPSYHQDDPSLMEAMQAPSIDVEQQWGPIYHRDDPAVVNGGLTLND